MDLEENIRIAAEVYWQKSDATNEQSGQVIEAYKYGAKSQAAKDYWYNEFKNTYLKERVVIIGNTGVNDRCVASAHNIQSIVPIADIIPEPINLEFDKQMIWFCISYNLPVHIVLNKADKLSNNQINNILQIVKSELKNFKLPVSWQTFSTITKLGKEELQSKILSCLEVY